MKKHWLAAFACLLALAVVACGEDEGTGGGETATDGTEELQVQLEPLNDSGVTGTATLTPQGEQIDVQIQADGLEAGQEHPQHLHRPDSGVGTCPAEDADTNGDGRISLEEGLPSYGPVRIEFTPFPVPGEQAGETGTEAEGAGTETAATETASVDYQEMLDLSSDAEPIVNGVVVLHGLTVDGAYDPELPVACGAVPGEEQVSDTGTQTETGTEPGVGTETQ